MSVNNAFELHQTAICRCFLNFQAQRLLHIALRHLESKSWLTHRSLDGVLQTAKFVMIKHAWTLSVSSSCLLSMKVKTGQDYHLDHY